MDPDDEPGTDTGGAPVVPDAAVDVSAFTAKIAQLEIDLAAKDTVISDLGNQLVAAKAVNYDLLMAVPTTEESTTENEPETDDDEDIDVDDLFGEKE